MPDTVNFRNLHPLPANVSPVGRKCVVLNIPDDPEWFGMLIGALNPLGHQSRYKRDEAKSGAIVASVWRGVIEDMLVRSALGDDCSPEVIEGCCEQFTPEQDWVAFFPQDPFTTPNFVPAGYLIPPFYTNPVLLPPFINSTDALLNILAFPVFQDLFELLETGLPRCEIHFQGSGQVEVELVKLINGGYAWIQLDDNPDNDQVIDLNQFAITEIADLEDFLDIIIEGKLNQTEIVEFNVEEAGDHKLVVYFLPNIGTDILFGFGGGIRSIEFCGGTQPHEGYFAMQMQAVPSGDCTLIQWRPNSVAEWIDLVTVCDGEAGADAPPLHMGFDAATCSLKYTQGDISSPYSGEGSEWITVFDWNMTDLAECLGLIGLPTIPPITDVFTDACNMAWAISRFVIDDLRALLLFRLSLDESYIGAGVASEIIMSGDYRYDWSWFLTLTSLFNIIDDAAIGDQATLDDFNTECQLASAIFSAMDTVDGTITLDAVEWDNNTEEISTGNAMIDAFIQKWVDTMAFVTYRPVVQEYMNRAALTEEEGECAPFDCEPEETGCEDFASIDPSNIEPGTQDTEFGNPAPSAKGEVNDYGFLLTIAIVVDNTKVVESVTADFFWDSNGVGNPSYIVFRGASLFNAGNVFVIASEDDGAPSEPRNEWFNRNFDFAYGSPVDVVKVTFGVGQSSGGTAMGWIDNVCVNYVE